MKDCRKCGETKPLSEFNSGKDAFGKHLWCKSCVKSYDRERHQQQAKKRRKQNKDRRKELKEWFKDYKGQLECLVCGENHPATLVFHHRDPNDKDNVVSDMVRNGFSKEKILKEIEKCDVLCANHHAIEHYNGE